MGLGRGGVRRLMAALYLALGVAPGACLARDLPEEAADPSIEKLEPPSARESELVAGKFVLSGPKDLVVELLPPKPTEQGGEHAGPRCDEPVPPVGRQNDLRRNCPMELAGFERLQVLDNKTGQVTIIHRQDLGGQPWEPVPGGGVDWTTWLGKLPLLWDRDNWQEQGSAPDPFLEFPLEHWDGLVVYPDTGCVSSPQDAPALYRWSAAKARGGIDSIEVRLGSSLKLISRAGQRETRCIPLRAENLRVHDGRLGFAVRFSEPRQPVRESDRDVVILDVSDRMDKSREEVGKALREFAEEGPVKPASTLVLVEAGVLVRLDAESWQKHELLAEVDRLQFSRRGENLLSTIAKSLHSLVDVSRCHCVTAIVAEDWLAGATARDFPLNSTGYINIVLERLAVRKLQVLVLGSDYRDTCRRLEDYWLRDSPAIAARVRCRDLERNELPKALRGGSTSCDHQVVCPTAESQQQPSPTALTTP